MIKRVSIFALGLAAVVFPARASLTYQSSASTFDSQATVTDELTLSSTISFTGSLSDSNSEYIDAADGIDFIALNGNASGSGSFTLSDGELQAGLGDKIEIEFTSSSIVGIGFAVSSTTNSVVVSCLDTNHSSCSGSSNIPNGGTAFVGALNDNPLPATGLPTLFIYPQSQSDEITLDSFVLAEPESTPEVRTMLMLGAGLMMIGLLHRKRRGVLRTM